MVDRKRSRLAAGQESGPEESAIYGRVSTARDAPEEPCPTGNKRGLAHSGRCQVKARRTSAPASEYDEASLGRDPLATGPGTAARV